MEQKECFLCGKNGMDDPLEQHHIFNGANRNKSDRYGLTVWLCGNECHRNGRLSAHRNLATRRNLQRYGQRKWMDDTGGSVDDFIREFGRNYLEWEPTE